MKSWGNPGSKRFERKKKAHEKRKAQKAAHMAATAGRHTFEAFCGNVGCGECFPLLAL